MARLKDIASGTQDIFKIDPRILRVKLGWNVRAESPERDAHISWLCDSIKELGVLEPLTVVQENDVVFVTDGENRLRATMLAIEDGADIKTVPCIADSRYASDADRTLGLITRNGGLPLTLLEKAEVFRRLHSYGWTVAEIAKKAGFSPKHVENTLQLLTLPADVKAMVEKGEVSATLAGETPPEKLKKAVEKAKAEGKERATKRHVDEGGDVWRPEGFAHPAIAMVYDLTAELEDPGQAKKIDKVALKLERMLWNNC